MEKTSQPYLIPAVIEHTQYVVQAYKNIVKENLLEGQEFYHPEELSYLLYHAPFVVLSHTSAVDPLFNYANLMAQQLFEMDWDTIVGLPSRHSVRDHSNENREELLKTALQKGYVDNYFGVRINAKDALFQIEKVVLWNLVDNNQTFIGQAAVFRHWTYM